MIDVELRDQQDRFFRELTIQDEDTFPGGIALITKDHASVIRRIFVRKNARKPVYREVSAVFILEDKNNGTERQQ